MRLLRRDDAGNVSFTRDLADAELSAHKYAILSHMWGSDEEEVSYQDIVSGAGTGKKGYEKIRFCAEQTKADGLRYFWVDTCCIDKRNAAELSKALISMFRWYSNAERCYVFLSDVPRREGSGQGDWERDFRCSRWFRRGWTLQELIAPSMLEFFTKDGRTLGTKTSLEPQISEITHIPIRALRSQNLPEFTSHERRQWQEGRETREPEDMVYSLLGLLDISMPVLYGEGRARALQRLENEINIVQKGTRHRDFSLVFSLPQASVETQHFVARRDELHAMHDRLFSDGDRKVVVLQGLGGIGKTQLAVAYAKRYRDSYSAVLWMSANDENSIRSSFAKVARRIAREHPSTPWTAGLMKTEQSLDQVVNAVNDWLSAPMNSRWLVIYDNYDNPKVAGNADPEAFNLRQYFPEAFQGSIIVTTRSAEVKLGHCMRIRKLEMLQDSLDVLGHASGREGLANDSSAIQLVRKLDGLPLALATAGAYLSQSTITFPEYLEFFNQSWARLHRQGPELTTYENRTLYSTWQISYELIQRRNPVSSGLLRWWAFFDNQDLWFELLDHAEDWWPEWMKKLTADKLEFQACVRVLCDHGLVEANTENKHEVESTGYSVHSCVHAWMSAVLNIDHDPILATAAVRCVAMHVPWRYTPNSSSKQRRLLNHAARCAGPHGVMSDRWDSYNWLGNLYNDQGKVTEAERMYRQALNNCEEASGIGNPDTLTIKHNLSSLYYRYGRLAEAEELYLSVLEGREQAFETDHTLTLETVNNLGALYLKQSRLAEAEKMLTRALEGREKTLGSDHMDTIETLRNLGALYLAQDRSSEAKEVIIRVIQGREKVLGADHPSVLSLHASLGNLSFAQGNYEEAEETFNRALRGRWKELGSEIDHDMPFWAVFNFGRILQSRDKLAEAESMHLRALEGAEKAFGSDNTYTLAIVLELGRLYCQQGRVAEAERQYKRAMAGYDTKSPYYQGLIDELGDTLHHGKVASV